MIFKTMLPKKTLGLQRNLQKRDSVVKYTWEMWRLSILQEKFTSPGHARDNGKEAFLT